MPPSLYASALRLLMAFIFAIYLLCHYYYTLPLPLFIARTPMMLYYCLRCHY